jgi:anti-sigma B factor antagonist
MLNWRDESNWAVVEMSGELDMGNANEFKKQIIDELVSKGNINVALDFTKMEYIDSSGLGVIVSLHKRCKINGGRLAICGMNETLSRLFKLTSLDKALNIYADFKDLTANG